MKTLDFYIIRQFVINFAILYVVLMTLFVVVDLIVDLDEFLEGGRNWARRQSIARQADQMGLPTAALTELIEDGEGVEVIAERMHISEDEAWKLMQRIEPGFLMRAVGVFRMIGDFYGPMIILVYAFFSGLIVVAAMGFTLSGLGRQRELTAMVSSGVSLYRVAMPILVAGIALNVLALPIQEFVIPELAGKLGRKKSHIKNITVERLAFQYIPDEKGALLSAASFDAEHEQLEGVRVLLRNADSVQVGHITAAQALWNEQAKGWDLIGGYQVDGRPVESPVETVDRSSVEVDFFKTDLSPTLIKTRRNADYVRLLPVRQLQQMQHSEAVPAAMRDVVARTKWGRVCLLLVNVLILAMGLPYFLLRSPGNMLMQSVKCAGLCIGVWAGGMTLPEMVSGHLNPVAAAWIPVVVYLPLSAYVLQKVKT
jgi:lipopolysaccharide export system permease protein